MSNNKHWSAKERIEYLLDENSFVEIGALVTKRNTDFNLSYTDAPSDGVITGYGIMRHQYTAFYLTIGWQYHFTR